MPFDKRRYVRQVSHMVISSLRSRLPPLGSLAAFEAASRHRSFTRAAAELNLTQAAISRQIHLLEEHLGVLLFERLRHSVVLTPDGERFAAKVNPALTAIGDATVAARSGIEDEFTIRTEFCLATHWLMPRLSQFQPMHPSLSIKVLTSNRPIETEQEQFDVGLGYGLNHGPNFNCEPLATDAMVPVCSPATRMRLPKHCSVADLASFNLIHFEQRGADWIDWKQYLENFGVKSIGPSRLSLSMYNSVIDAALQGYGVALAWRYTIDALLKDGRLLEIEGMALDYPAPLSAQFHSHRKPTPAVKQFTSWIRTQLGQK